MIDPVPENGDLPQRSIRPTTFDRFRLMNPKQRVITDYNVTYLRYGEDPQNPTWPSVGFPVEVPVNPECCKIHTFAGVTNVVAVRVTVGVEDVPEPLICVVFLPNATDQSFVGAATAIVDDNGGATELLVEVAWNDYQAEPDSGTWRVQADFITA